MAFAVIFAMVRVSFSVYMGAHTPLLRQIKLYRIKSLNIIFTIFLQRLQSIDFSYKMSIFTTFTGKLKFFIFQN